MKNPVGGLRRKAAVALSTICLGVGLLVAPVAPAQAAGILPTTTTVQASGSPVLVGTPVTLTAKVSVLGLGGLLIIPTGQVTFTAVNGGPPVTLGSAALSPFCLLTPCTATLTTSALAVGTNTIKASYAGDLLAAASSGTTSVVVNTAVPCAPNTPTAESQVGSVELTWSSPCDGGSQILSYRLYRSDTAGGTYTQIATDLPTGRYQDTTGVVGTPYFYKATAVNAVGESPQSGSVGVASTSLGGPGTFSTTSCGVGPCASPTSSGDSGSGYLTSVSVSTGASAGAHTVTAAIGGPMLTGCVIPGAGLGATFNDTAGDARKIVTWTTRGTEADATFNYYNPTTGYEGCLGLGTPWYSGSLSNPAIWNAADGLYEAAPPLCVNNGDFFISPGVYSQPCTDVSYQQVGPISDHFYEIAYNLPPGDGRLGGGS